jgi:hypothetical protein
MEYPHLRHLWKKEVLIEPVDKELVQTLFLIDKIRNITALSVQFMK